MASLTKTIQTPLVSLQSIASNSKVIGTPLSVANNLAATVMIHFGRRSASALTAPVNIRIEASAKSSGDEHWYPLVIFQSTAAAVTSQAVNGTCASAQAVVPMTSTTGQVLSDIVYIDNGTVGNSCWGRICVITSNTSITLEDNLINAQTSSTVYNGAQIFMSNLDLTAVQRIRAVVDADNTGQAVAVEIECVTADSFA